MRLDLWWLYPSLMNIYGDRGNIIVLRQRCAWREIEVEVHRTDPGMPVDPQRCDLVFIGGGQDSEQRAIADDLRRVKGDGVRAALREGAVLLAVCGGYQLMGHYYRDAAGQEMRGLSIFDLWTHAPLAGARRCIGNITMSCSLVAPARTLVGFENHGGRTYLGGTPPLGRVLAGFGNNGEDGLEGAAQGNAFGTYLHGSLLPKNPWFADFLIEAALRRRYGQVTLAPLDDQAEVAAHAAALRLSSQPAAGTQLLGRR